MQTFQPRRENRIALAAPIPDDDPGMTHTFLSIHLLGGWRNSGMVRGAGTWTSFDCFKRNAANSGFAQGSARINAQGEKMKLSFRSSLIGLLALALLAL